MANRHPPPAGLIRQTGQPPHSYGSQAFRPAHPSSATNGTAAGWPNTPVGHAQVRPANNNVPNHVPRTPPASSGQRPIGSANGGPLTAAHVNVEQLFAAAEEAENVQSTCRRQMCAEIRRKQAEMDEKEKEKANFVKQVRNRTLLLPVALKFLPIVCLFTWLFISSPLFHFVQIFSK
jgi:hypothetical protein